MGNWNRRYQPRRKYHNYQEPPPSPPASHFTQYYSPGVQENNVPSWERNFCFSMGVPWHKVVAAKRYMHCHDSVVKWNDIAGEEAFHDAKRRYWEMINGLPSEYPLPDPDLYIDEVDWDSSVDPILISDLDREFFNPDEQGNSGKLDTTLEVGKCSLVKTDEKADNGNPWERSLMQGNGDLNFTAQRWSQWDAPEQLKTSENPWEQSCSQVDRSWKNNAWGGAGAGSWKNQEQKYNGQFGDINNPSRNLWSQGRESVECMKMKGWGNKHLTNGYNSWEPINRRNQWGNNYAPASAAPNDRRGGDWGNKALGWKNSEHVNDESRFVAVNAQTRDGRPPYNGSRKREGGQQHVTRYKSSRFQSNDQGMHYRFPK